MAEETRDGVTASMGRQRIGCALVVLDPAHLVQVEVGVLDGGLQRHGPAIAGPLHPGGKDVLPGALEPGSSQP